MFKLASFTMLASLLMLTTISSATLRAEETESDRKEAAVVQKMLGDNKLDTISGKLILETVEEGKEPPKVIGTLFGAKDSYKVQLMDKNQYKDILPFNNQTVNLVGHVVEKEDQGKTIYFENFDIAAPRAPSRNKRGGF